MAGELLNELKKIERLKAACHTKLSETESGTAVRISPRRVCHLANL